MAIKESGILPGSQSSPGLPTSPLQKPSAEYNFLQRVVQLLHCQQVFAGVSPYLVKGHLLLADMIVQGYRPRSVVALSKVQSEEEEPAIKEKLLTCIRHYRLILCHS